MDTDEMRDIITGELLCILRNRSEETEQRLRAAELLALAWEVISGGGELV